MVLVRKVVAYALWDSHLVNFSIWGKSGLRRAGCRITSGGGNSKESATESILPYVYMEKVKWQCKRLPLTW